MEADSDFVGCLAGNLRAASRLLSRRYDAALRGDGLRISQIAILALVDRHGPLSMSELAAGMSSERSAISRDVAILEREGLLCVGNHATDGRSRAVSVTDLGRRRLRSAAPAWQQAQHEAREMLGAPLAAELLDVTRRVVAALER